MRSIRGNAYLSRPVGAGNKPYRRLEVRRKVVDKEVFIGNHKPTDHFAPAAGIFVPQEALYDNQRRKKR